MVSFNQRCKQMHRRLPLLVIVSTVSSSASAGASTSDAHITVNLATSEGVIELDGVCSRSKRGERTPN